MNEIRTFIAIDLPPFLKDFISKFIAYVGKYQQGVKWINTDNLHITLKFIGEQDHKLTEKIESILDPIAKEAEPFEARLTYIGAFPNKNKPRVLWLKITANPRTSIINLQSSIDSRLELLGIEREKRVFSPHLTIGRVKQPADLRQFWAYEKEHPFPPIIFKVKSFSLFQSTLKRSGAEYKILKNYSLQ